MASAFSHAIAAIALGKLRPGKAGWKFFLLGTICAVIPDVDVLSFSFGIPYEHWLGHRGFTHSIVFAVLLGVFVTIVFYRRETLFTLRWFGLSLYFTLATVSHGILDAITNGGLGVGFFIPFDNSRYFFPYTPVQVSPIGAGNFFTERGWRVLQSEFIWIWAPCLVLILIAFLIKKK